MPEPLVLFTQTLVEGRLRAFLRAALPLPVQDLFKLTAMRFALRETALVFSILMAVTRAFPQHLLLMLLPSLLLLLPQTLSGGVAHSFLVLKLVQARFVAPVLGLLHGPLLSLGLLVELHFLGLQLLLLAVRRLFPRPFLFVELTVASEVLWLLPWLLLMVQGLILRLFLVQDALLGS